MIIMIYWAFTTLSTIGLGDYHPKNNVERMTCVVFFLFGVTCFTFITNHFLIVINKLLLISKENEDYDNLSRFFGLLCKFNKQRKFSKQFTQQIESYFEYYWKNDHNYCLSSIEDQRFFVELPYNIKNRVYRDFLFMPFVNQFRKLFEIPLNIEIRHSYYTWFHEEYSNFIIAFLKLLEPRCYQPGQIIHSEYEDIYETNFIMRGLI